MPDLESVQERQMIWKITNQSKGYWQKCQGPWRLICVEPVEKEEFAITNLDSILDFKDIGIAIVPFVADNEQRCTWDLVCQEEYLEALANQLPDFIVKTDYVPTASTAYLRAKFSSSRVGDAVVKDIAEDEFLENAVKAIKADSWDRGPATLYREAAMRSDLSVKLAIRLLKHEIKNASEPAQESFCKNVLFMCLSVMAPLEDNEAVKALQLYKLDEWTRLIHGQEVTSGPPSESELRTIALLRRLLRRCQDPIAPGLEAVIPRSSFTHDEEWHNDAANRQAVKCAAFFRVTASGTFGDFNTDDMESAVKESVLFADDDFVPPMDSWRSWMSELLSTQEHLNPLSEE